MYNTSVTFAGGLASNSYILVDRYGQRFMDDMKPMVHQKESLELLHFDPKLLGYPHIPFFMVFDEKARQSGSIAKVPMTWGWCSTHRVYDWSEDNSAEIEEGWIFQADTIEELATKMTAVDRSGNAVGVDPAGLVDTVSTFNEYCLAGEDPKFGRSEENLVAIDTPPYYGVELCLSVIYTLGGLKNNTKSQTLDREGNPISRLYSAGNVGGSGVVSPGAIPEALVFGRTSGKNAAAEQPWS
jgi:hypothetical protein